MTFTHEQLAHAVREVGSSGKPFSSAAVRGLLGMTTQDRRALTRFNNELRAYQKSHPSELSLLGNNRYKLLVQAAVSEAAPPALERAQPARELGAGAEQAPGAPLLESVRPQVFTARSVAATAVEQHEAARSGFRIAQPATPGVQTSPELSRPALETALAAQVATSVPRAVERRRPSRRAKLRALIGRTMRPLLLNVLTRGYRLKHRVVERMARATGVLRARSFL